ncbi:hypothetical protein JD844_019797 [Phrynosoma platyrhinos]|uniref:Transmembrane channel-like protein n=1 Tax=Phrynosoma platyrhinos TaxID=52577 RepID=A0ABQ7TT33_PHRPL|nr:hypothetical protein JD844_019797 [Phrynosoma platyrhinos]
MRIRIRQDLKSFRQFKNSLCDYFQLFKLWQKILKDIGGKFGTSVRSYFAFLTWLLMFNIFSFLVNFSFITVPQLIAAKPNNLSFTGLEFFTGAGYFKDTVLYYGFYTNSTVVKNETLSPYYMQLAYIFTMGIYFIVCFLSLLYSPQMYSGNAAKLLCIWDFSITNAKAVKLKQKNISTQIKFLLDEKKTDLESEAATLVLPIIASLINHIVPFLYSFFGFVEKFTHPRHQIYTTIIRNIILKVSIIGILCNYWLNKVALSNAECWETLVGQDIYRLLVADFICCLLGSFFGEFLQRIIGTKCCKKLGVPEFDIARNVLDLIYAQTLTWIGIFFSPLLPAIQMISFFIIFCVKKVSLMMNCQPPRKAWRASQMNTIFVFLLFFPSFAGVLAVIAITVWRYKNQFALDPLLFTCCLPTKCIFHCPTPLKALQEQKKETMLSTGTQGRVSKLCNDSSLGRSAILEFSDDDTEGNSSSCQGYLILGDSVAPLSARISEMTSFSHGGVREDDQSARNVGISEALALALRARQEAEWKMDDEEST